jgi:hypothetical protein
VRRVAGSLKQNLLGAVALECDSKNASNVLDVRLAAIEVQNLTRSP